MIFKQDYSSLFKVLEGEGSYLHLPPPPALQEEQGRAQQQEGDKSDKGDKSEEPLPPVLDVFSAAIGRSFHKRLFPDQVWGVKGVEHV